MVLVDQFKCSLYDLVCINRKNITGSLPVSVPWQLNQYSGIHSPFLHVTVILLGTNTCYKLWLL